MSNMTPIHASNSVIIVRDVPKYGWIVKKYCDDIHNWVRVGDTHGSIVDANLARDVAVAELLFQRELAL